MGTKIGRAKGECGTWKAFGGARGTDFHAEVQICKDSFSRRGAETQRFFHAETQRRRENIADDRNVERPSLRELRIFAPFW
jgi:hypothetical protein